MGGPFLTLCRSAPLLLQKLRSSHEFYVILLIIADSTHPGEGFFKYLSERFY